MKLRLRKAAGLLILVVVVSTAGAYWLDLPDATIEKALWFTLNLISTVGSLDNLTVAQQWWAMVIMIFGLGAAFYGFSNLTAVLTSGEILHIFERRRMEKRIDNLKEHVVICGFGATGQLITERLQSHRIDFVVIESDTNRATHAKELGYHTIADDCTLDSVLDVAGVDRAHVLVATLDSDASNVFVVLSARAVNENMHIVARANLPKAVRKLERAGANHVIVPSQIAAHQLANAAIRPAVGEFVAQVMGGEEIELLEVPIASFPWMSEQSIRELNLMRRADLIVFAWKPKEGKQLFNPPPDTVVHIGDVLLAVGRDGTLDRLDELS